MFNRERIEKLEKKVKSLEAIIIKLDRVLMDTNEDYRFKYFEDNIKSKDCLNSFDTTGYLQNSEEHGVYTLLMNTKYNINLSPYYLWIKGDYVLRGEKAKKLYDYVRTYVKNYREL